MVERNAEVAPDKRIEFRIGIHLGDIVEESDGDLMGDGVNIAARLQGVAKAGGICISDDAYRQVKSRLDLKVSDLGPVPLKNIAEPMRAYLLEVGARPEAKPAPQGKPAAPPGKPRGLAPRWPAVTAVFVVAVLAAGAYAWHAGFASRLLGTSIEDKLATAPRLSIVVLPFENLSGDKEQDYFADGMTDDLTTDLSHLPDSFVISRGTAFTYKGKAIDAKQIGKELGVRYLLEGSVRRVGETITVNAQLISTETGAHVWADRFDGERSKLGDLQVEFVSRLANSLGVELVKAEALRAARERPSNPDAVDLVMRGQVIYNSNAKDAAKDASTLFERALALDPNNVPAMIGLTNALNWRVTAQLSEDPASDIARAEKTIDAALALQPDNSSAHAARGDLFFNKRQWGPSIAEAETAVTEDHNNADARATASFRKVFLGRSEDSFAGVETALRLSPRDPNVPSWQFYMCHLYTHLGQWEKSIEWCNKSIAGGFPWFGTFVDLAAANAWAGHDKEARDAAAELQKAYPGFTVQTWAGIHWTDDPTFNAQYERIVEGLRKAGVPEGDKKTD
jgi:TolB-like protein/tetratricopeptide (TPR) repeat protein